MAQGLEHKSREVRVHKEYRSKRTGQGHMSKGTESRAQGVAAYEKRHMNNSIEARSRGLKYKDIGTRARM